jgi:hypothetical protein
MSNADHLVMIDEQAYSLCEEPLRLVDRLACDLTIAMRLLNENGINVDVMTGWIGVESKSDGVGENGS